MESSRKANTIEWKCWYKNGLVGKAGEFVVFQAHQCPVTLRLAIDERQASSMHMVPKQSLAARKSMVSKPHVLHEYLEIYIYIYIKTERERGRERETQIHRNM